VSRLSQKVRKIARQGNVIQATVLDVIGSRATVKLSTNGAVYAMLSIVGGPVSKGEVVRVNFGSGTPFVMAPITGITEALVSRTRPLAPIAHMNAEVATTSSGSSGEPAPPGVAYYNFMFAPALGGSLSSGSFDPKWRLLFGGGPYNSWGSSAWDYFGASNGPAVGLPDDGVVPDNTVAFVIPRNFSTLKITPVVRMTSSFTQEATIWYELYSYTPSWSTGGYEQNNYWDISYLYDPLPIIPVGGSVNGCLTAYQCTFPNDWMDGSLGAGDMIVIYFYLLIEWIQYAQPFFMQGFFVEMTG